MFFVHSKLPGFLGSRILEFPRSGVEIFRVDVLMSHFPPFFREGTLKFLGKDPVSLEGIVDSCGIRSAFVGFFWGWKSSTWKSRLKNA